MSDQSKDQKQTRSKKSGISLKRKFQVLSFALFIFWGGEEWIRRNQGGANGPASQEELLSAAAMMRLPLKKPAANLNRPLIELGKKFFFDPRFSKSKTISCASCHDPKKSFTDGKRVAVGLDETTMNAPTLINAARGRWFFHNGRADSLEMQALGPVENPKEHGFSRVEVFDVIKNFYQADYQSQFGRLPSIILPAPSTPTSLVPWVADVVAAYALGTLGSKEFQTNVIGRATGRRVQPIQILQEDASASFPKSPPSDFDRCDVKTREQINLVFLNFGRALAAFERTILTEDTPFDQFVDRFLVQQNPEKSYVLGFGANEYNGFKLFVGEGKCTLCHQGTDFTDHQFHNIGLPALDTRSIDLGRAQGVLLAKSSPFNCEGNFFKHGNVNSESCAELKFAATENSELIGAFKTPTLRNLRDTAPYGHDGRFAKLRDILIHYNQLEARPAVGHREESVKPLHLSDPQLSDLEAFLLSLYGNIVME